MKDVVASVESLRVSQEGLIETQKRLMEAVLQIKGALGKDSSLTRSPSPPRLLRPLPLL